MWKPIFLDNAKLSGCNADKDCKAANADHVCNEFHTQLHLEEGQLKPVFLSFLFVC